MYKSQGHETCAENMLKPFKDLFREAAREAASSEGRELPEQEEQEEQESSTNVERKHAIK